jgi:hypothetical protein
MVQIPRTQSRGRVNQDLIMSSIKPYKAPTGTFTATVDGIHNFTADIIVLSVGRSLAVAGAQDNNNSVVRTIETRLDPDIANGTYDFNDGPEIHMLGVFAPGPEWFVTQSGSVTVDFDRSNDHYKGSMEINAQDIFSGKVIHVVAQFDLRGITPVHTHKHK